MQVIKSCSVSVIHTSPLGGAISPAESLFPLLMLPFPFVVEFRSSLEDKYALTDSWM